MDVFGEKPLTERGKYFRNNVWYWHPLWAYCEFLEPDICSKVEYGHSNSGDGLNASDSKKLSMSLKKALHNGHVELYKKTYDEEITNLPDEDCFCTVRHLSVNSSDKECTACKGSKKMKNYLSGYYFEVDNVKEFADFLMDCGGFSIC